MLKTVLVLGALAVVFAAAWIALRRAHREPELPTFGPETDAYMRNIRSTTGDFGRRPPPSGEMDPMNAPMFPTPPQTRD